MAIGDNPCGNIAWWVWLLIALFVGVLIGLTVFVIGKYHRKHPEVHQQIPNYPQLHPTIEVKT